VRSYVVTGGAHGVGRAVVERLVAGGDAAVAVDLDPGALEGVPGGLAVAGDAADEDVAAQAADLAEDAAPLAGWVNNAAVFRDALLQETPPREILALVAANLDAAVVGCAVAARRLLAAGAGGSIVNVSSHQARRPVPGCLPYATAKAAIEGLTRALAVDLGPSGIRVNAVALGTIRTERYDDALGAHEPGTAARLDRDTGRLHALERVGRVEEAAAAIVHLLSDDASFVSGATLPVDGGRSALAREPQL
jgi:NAD(P)-dependent dehydrogenase (short-subunit alcohol dehydrogenase family)